jgi:hypothetical protein
MSIFKKNCKKNLFVSGKLSEFRTCGFGQKVRSKRNVPSKIRKSALFTALSRRHWVSGKTIPGFCSTFFTRFFPKKVDSKTERISFLKINTFDT